MRIFSKSDFSIETAKEDFERIFHKEGVVL